EMRADAAGQQGLQDGLDGDDDEAVADAGAGEQVDVARQRRPGGDDNRGAAGDRAGEVRDAGPPEIVVDVLREVAERGTHLYERRDNGGAHRVHVGSDVRVEARGCRAESLLARR